MRILSVGWFRNISSTSLHRHKSLEKIAGEIDMVELGAEKFPLSSRIVYQLFQRGIPVKLPDTNKANVQIKAHVLTKEYDIVWIDKGVTINKKTLCFIKKHLPKVKIIGFSPDNMALRHNQSQNYLESLPYYDFTITTKSYILDDLRKLGAKNVIFMNKTYSDDFHYPRQLSKNELIRLGADVGFIGAWEKERCESILYLAKNNIKVKVYGDGKWNDYKNVNDNLIIEPGIFSEDYPKALQAFKISLCFLRKMNFDQQTARTMEIPACGGFMLAERTNEHMELFVEGKEAVFFSSDEELLKHCQYYLEHEDARNAIATAGLEKCKHAGYSNDRTIKKIVGLVYSHV